MSKQFEELRRELFKSDCDVVLALRLAHTIAKKNKMNDFDMWIQNELNGYKCTTKDLPNYRKIKGNIKALNPFYGWIPYVIEDNELENLFSTATMFEPISSIVQLCKDQKNSIYTFRYRGDIHKKLEEQVDAELDIQLHVNIAHICNIIEAVKSRLTEWVIENDIDDNGKTEVMEEPTVVNQKKAFIVHGHDGELRESVARLLEKQGITPIILFEQPNQGATIIEKFEVNSNVGAAICLFSADDIGNTKNAKTMNNRARQNVVFESGFFIGKFGRKRVIIIADKSVELPSDLQGVVYTDVSNWKYDVLKELKAMGYIIDYNKLDS
ncbi:MAG: nucleotide-binding protein [Clostridia bacterium]|nr:nucleotide-binding protein [Clostridia bacterium]